MLSLFFATVVPIILFLFMLLIKKWPLLWASLITLAIMTALAIFYWQILPAFFINAFLKGVLVALDIFVIVVGAIFFLEIQKKIKVIDNIGFYLGSFSKDYRVQTILLAWFLENFIEGTAGFGTPSVVVAPLLIGLGLNPMTAIVISLLGNSASVVFGAAGAPIRVGLAGLSTTSVPWLAAWFNFVGLLVPVFMLWVLVAKEKQRWAQFFEALPFAVWSGLAFVISCLVTVHLGQEFPSILGAVLSLVVVLATTRLGIFVPRKIRHLGKVVRPKSTLPLYQVVFPYALLIGLLLVGKFTLGSVTIKLFQSGTYAVGLFNPGLAFLIAGVVVAAVWGKSLLLPVRALGTSLRRGFGPFMVIAAMSSIVQLMIVSGNNSSAIPSALEYAAQNFATPYLPFWAPMIGAFGSFLTGSATVSNIMFGHLFQTASLRIGLDVGLVLALGLVGAAAGNMVALADILSAEAVAGMRNKETQILKAVFPFCAIYLLLVGMLGFLFSR